MGTKLLLPSNDVHLYGSYVRKKARIKWSSLSHKSFICGIMLDWAFTHTEAI